MSKNVVISVAPETKTKIDQLRDEMFELHGFKISYSDAIKMLIKNYYQPRVKPDDRQYELDLGDDGKEETFDLFERVNQ